MWICSLDSGATLFIFDDSDFDSNYKIRQAMADSRIGDVYLLNPPVPVATVENHSGYLKLMDIEYTPSLIVTRHELPYENKSFQEMARNSALLQFETIGNSDKVVCFDAETTGLDTQFDEFVSFGCYSAVDSHYTLIQPTEAGLVRMKSNGVSDIHHIYPKDLETAPTFTEVYRDLYDRLESKLWLVYNANFDVSMLDSLCDRHMLPHIPRLGVHCAMKLFAQLQAEPNDKKNMWLSHKLEKACTMYDVHLDNAHNALSDATATYELINRVLEIGVETSDNEIPF